MRRIVSTSALRGAYTLLLVGSAAVSLFEAAEPTRTEGDGTEGDGPVVARGASETEGTDGATDAEELARITTIATTTTTTTTTASIPLWS